MRFWIAVWGTLFTLGTMGACGRSENSTGATDASPIDAGGDSDAPDAADIGPMPASPVGTWQLEYGSGCEGAGPDLVFVRQGTESTYHADFADRRPVPAACGPAAVPEYVAGATYNPLTNALVLALDTHWCFSGEDQCDQREVVLTITQESAAGSLQWKRCQSTDPGAQPVTCTATAVRLAHVGDCVGVTGNDACSGTAVCNSGCGTPCRCEDGLWSCEYPPVGSICRVGEACTYKQSPLGGFDGLSCMDVEGDLRFDGSLSQGGSVCPVDKPTSGELCGPWPAALSCAYPSAATSCVCQLADGGQKAWACG